jgi:hypothetical protein
MPDLTGKFVYIKGKGNSWYGGQWGIVRGHDGGRFYLVGIAGDTQGAAALTRDELTVPRDQAGCKKRAGVKE